MDLVLNATRWPLFPRRQDVTTSVWEFYRERWLKNLKNLFNLHAVSKIEPLLFHIHSPSCKTKKNRMSYTRKKRVNGKLFLSAMFAEVRVLVGFKSTLVLSDGARSGVVSVVLEVHFGSLKSTLWRTQVHFERNNFLLFTLSSIYQVNLELCEVGTVGWISDYQPEGPGFISRSGRGLNFGRPSFTTPSVDRDVKPLV